MKIKRITRSWLRSNGACYPDYRLRKLVPKGGVTPQQVLDTDQIPNEDKIWVVTREGLLPKTIIAAWLAGMVERALGRIVNPDPRSVAVVSMLRRIASGEEVGQEELARTRNEARHAAADADYAAYHAAADAYHAAADACYAAYYAAYYAYYAAYHATCHAADYAAQRDEERKQQIQDLLVLLED